MSFRKYHLFYFKSSGLYGKVSSAAFAKMA